MTPSCKIKNEKLLTRLFEIFPGLLAWIIILTPAIGGLFFPELVAYFILAFIAFWFVRSFKSAIFGLIGYFLVSEWQKVDWYKKWQDNSFKNKLRWQDIKHVVLIPTYNESTEVLSRALDGLKNQEQLEKKQLYVVLAMEERAKGRRERAKYLLDKYKGVFGLLTVTEHPAGLPGEVVGKASNEAWGAKRVKEILDSKKLPLEMITVSSCDSDARFNKNYFAALTYAFSVNEDRYIKFWQSPIFWYNNLNNVPFFIKMLGVIGHAIHLADLQEPSRLIFSYSAYSLSFKLLDKVGYWDTDIIPEDWHLFLQAFFGTKGMAQVEPIYLPTFIDAPEAKSWAGTFKNRYEQCKRHAWGATDIPYAIKQSLIHKEIPASLRFMRVYKMIETHIIWSTNWFLLTLGASLPVLINPAFSRTSLGYSLPKIAQATLTACLLALFIMILTDYLLRPKELKPKNVFQFTKEVLQWITLPIVSLPLSVLPGLHAQTMLMLGKRLEYKVTEKV